MTFTGTSVRLLTPITLRSTQGLFSPIANLNFVCSATFETKNTGVLVSVLFQVWPVRTICALLGKHTQLVRRKMGAASFEICCFKLVQYMLKHLPFLLSAVALSRRDMHIIFLNSKFKQKYRC